MTNNKKIKKERTLFQKIVNVFLYIGLGIFVLFLIALGFTQTSTFREYLKDIIVTEANDALNGKLDIGKIDGTIFTSIILRNTVLTQESDTLLNASKIDIRTSPLKLMFRIIYFRKIEITDAKINLVADSTGELNISKLFPPSEEEPEPTESEFPYKIQVYDLKLNNIDFSMQDYRFLNSESYYDNINTDDLRIKNLNLALGAFADIKEDYYRLHLRSFSFNPNFTFFDLKNLSGKFEISKKGTAIRGLNLKTNNSDVNIDLTLLGFNPLDSTAFDNLDNVMLDLKLEAFPFSFADLSTFVPDTDFLIGSVFLSTSFNGEMNDLKIEDLSLKLNDTEIKVKGKILNLMSPDDMYFSTILNDSKINSADVNNLMPSLELPDYSSAGTIRLETLSYEGNPLNFISVFNINTDAGRLSGKAAMDLRNEPAKYDVEFKTRNLDLKPFAGIQSKLNLLGTAKGMGFSPDEINSKISLAANNSELEGIVLNSFTFDATGADKMIEYELRLNSDTTLIDMKGSFDFNETEKASYTLAGTVQNLNLADIANDSSLISNLNLTLNADGKSFNIEELDLFVILSVDDSHFNGLKIDSTRAIVDIRSGNGDERIINVISDLADITITGSFSVVNTVDMIVDELDYIINAFNEKYKEIFPEEFGTLDLIPVVNRERHFTGASDQITDLLYQIEFKDFTLLSLILGDDHLEVDGEISGGFKSTADGLHFAFNTNMNYLKYWGEKDVFFFSGFNLRLELLNDFYSTTSEGINLDLAMDLERLFAGADLYDLSLKINLKENFLRFDVNGKYEDLSSLAINGSADLGRTLHIEIDRFNITLNQFEIVNRHALKFKYASEKLQIEDFILVRNEGNIVVEGVLDKKGNQDLKLTVTDLRALDIGWNFAELGPDQMPDASINIEAFIKGRFTNPLMNVRINIDSISFKEREFGHITSTLDYRNENLNIELSFIDSLINPTKPALHLSGSIPLNLSLEKQEDRMIEYKPMNLTLTSADFNLGSLGDVVPGVRKLRGYFNAGITLTGSLEEPVPAGFVTVTNGAFILEGNDLEYNAGLKINISHDEISIDSLLIANAQGTRDGGKMTGGGLMKLDNFKVISSDFYISGDLKVLGENSRSVSPSVYGDLVIATRGNIRFNSSEDRNHLVAQIAVRVADLTFAPVQSAYQSASESFVYRFIEDTISTTEEEMDFDALIRLAQQRESESVAVEERTSLFDYELDIRMERESKFTIYISREFNQKLIAILSGNFRYEMIGGRQNAQGEFNLLEGSTLQFFKTFIAEGSLRFESEPDNPYLNITATYIDYYTPPDTTLGEIEVAVKIKLEGPLNELDKNFIQHKENIAVYYGANNIEKNQPDPSKDASDAVMFILTGKFVSEATPQDKSNAAGQLSGTATSLAGSLLGGFLNNLFGDYVRTVELRTVGTSTKFHITGRVQDIRYSIGGTTDVFQDVSKANVRIEYPLYRNLLLRLERKEPVTETTFSSEMINEMGIKYRFEF